MTRSVNHGSTELVTRVVNDGSAVDKCSTIHKLTESFQSIQRSVHGISIDSNSRIRDCQIVAEDLSIVPLLPQGQGRRRKSKRHTRRRRRRRRRREGGKQVRERLRVRVKK